MAELLLRGWNTTIPEVDVGDDIFVVRDNDGNLPLFWLLGFWNRLFQFADFLVEG